MTLAFTPDGKKAYVARGNFLRKDDTDGEIKAPLSVINTKTRSIIKTLWLKPSVTLVAVTPDGRLVLVANGLQISVIDTQTDRVLDSLPIEAAADGIAITENKSAYVWIPDTPRLFLLGLSEFYK